MIAVKLKFSSKIVSNASLIGLFPNVIVPVVYELAYKIKGVNTVPLGNNVGF